MDDFVCTFISGAIGGAGLVAAGQPFDTVKVRGQYFLHLPFDLLVYFFDNPSALFDSFSIKCSVNMDFRRFCRYRCCIKSGRLFFSQKYEILDGDFFRIWSGTP